MTEPTNRTQRVPPSETPRKKPASRGGSGLAWKSGILAASLGVVMLGWSALHKSRTRPRHKQPRRCDNPLLPRGGGGGAPVQISQLPSAQVAAHTAPGYAVQARQTGLCPAHHTDTSVLIRSIRSKNPLLVTLHEHTFRAMNTSVSVWLWAEILPLTPVRLAEVETLFVKAEFELSRFRPTSGLSRLNARAGTGAQAISPLLLSVLSAALDAAGASGGIFDPTVLTALRQAGYDHSFELLATGDDKTGAKDERPSRIDWRQARLDLQRGTAELPAGLGIDLGGIAKGWVVDRAAEMLGAWGAALVDAGGDLRGHGAARRRAMARSCAGPLRRNQGPACDRPHPRRYCHKQYRQTTLGATRPGHAPLDRSAERPAQPERPTHRDPSPGPTTAEAEVVGKGRIDPGPARGRRYLGERGLAGILVGVDRRLELVGKLLIIDTVS